MAVQSRDKDGHYGFMPGPGKQGIPTAAPNKPRIIPPAPPNDPTPGTPEIQAIYANFVNSDPIRNQPAVPPAAPDFETNASQEDNEVMDGYHGAHAAPCDDGYSRPITELLTRFAPDVLEHPDWYSGPIDAETEEQLRRVIADPNTLVTVYRAAPATVNSINNGDWVTLSRDYASQHGIQDEEPGHDWPILSVVVPATQVFTDGNDLNEFGLVSP